MKPRFQVRPPEAPSWIAVGNTHAGTEDRSLLHAILEAARSGLIPTTAVPLLDLPNAPNLRYATSDTVARTRQVRDANPPSSSLATG